MVNYAVDQIAFSLKRLDKYGVVIRIRAALDRDVDVVAKHLPHTQ